MKQTNNNVMQTGALPVREGSNSTGRWLYGAALGCLVTFAVGCSQSVEQQTSETVTAEGVSNDTDAMANDNMANTDAMSAADRDPIEVIKSLEPAGPAPAWGKSITDPMLLVIEELDKLRTGPPLPQLTATQARQAPTPADAVKALMQEHNLKMPTSQVDTMGTTIPVEGGSIHARVYTPQNASATNPGIVYYHGGGWVIAGIDAYDASAKALAEKTGAVVVAVAYRQAPEHKFPTAHNDAFAAYKWVVNNAQQLKINPDKVAVAGESAGGNLAASVAIMARDNNVKMPVHQLLVYPIAGYDMNTRSYQEYADAKPLSKPAMNWFFDKYLRTAKDGQDPRIALVKVNNLKNLPPATVINAQIDPLQTEGQQYAENLKAAGVPVKAKVFDGVTHEFFGMAAVLPQAKDAQAMAVDELKKSFGM